VIYMKIIRAYKTELKPNNKQRSWLRGCCGASRIVYNWALNEWNEWFLEDGIRPVSQTRLKKYFNCMIKEEQYAWLSQYPYSIQEATFINLGRAFNSFYRQKKDGTVDKRIQKLRDEGKWDRRIAKALDKGWHALTVYPGYPRFKRYDNNDSFQLKEFTVYDTHIELGRKRDDIAKIGPIRLKERGYIPTAESGAKYTTYATVSQKAGHWYISVQVHEEIPKLQNDSVLVIGVDFGLKALAVCSDGTVYESPKPLREAQSKLKRLQKELSRRQKGGQNWKKTKAKITKQHARIANIRKHILHDISHDLVVNKYPAMIVIEDLNVSGMLRNHHLAQALSDVSFGELRRQIEYKAQWNGVEVVVADRWFPSSKLCRFCGSLNDDLALSDREWTCDCGATLDRDLNAAMNLAAYGQKAETQPDCLGS